jgi:tetratricopeptide (TPR) repeat protein
MRGLCSFVLLAACAAMWSQDASSVSVRGLSAQSVSEALLNAGTSAATVQSIQADLSAKAYVQVESKLVAQIRTSVHPQSLLEILGGVFFLDLKYLDSAIAFKKAEKYGPLTTRERFMLAMSYIELKRNRWAREELRRLSKDAPAEPLYPYWLGRLDYDDQRFADGRTNFKKAIQVNSHFVRAYDGLGLCEEALGNLMAAEENYQSANTLNREQGSHLAWPALNYGALLRRSSRYEQAKALLNEALKIDPSLAKAYYERGRVEESLGHRDSALKDLNEASTLDPHDPSPLYSMFRIYKESGQTELAATAMARFRAVKGGQ